MRLESYGKKLVIYRLYIWIAMGVLFLFTFIYALYFAAPKDFPTHRIFEISDGKTISEVALEFKRESFIKSAKLFTALVLMRGGGEGLIAGKYFFDNRRGVIRLSKIVTEGQYGLEPIRVRILEGSNNREIAMQLKKTLPEFDSEAFVEKAANLEGYLFPDTYFFLPTSDEDEVIKVLNNTFKKNTNEFENILNEDERTFGDIIIMASILEKEAYTLESKKAISGILWKRFEIGMPLQVDAVFIYILGKNTFELSLEDLEVDSPYNTYKYSGLPVGPIGNPGLASIQAAIYYDENPYFYYLSDKQGNIYYAENFEDHITNKEKYLWD